MNTPIVLFTNKDVELSNKLINELFESRPECCQLTMANKLDFNKEILEYRYDPKIVSIFKQNYDSSCFRIDHFDSSEGIPYVTLDEESDIEILDKN